MSSLNVGRMRLALVGAAVALGVAATAAPAVADVDTTVWICKPGQADDLCAGTIDGTTLPPPGQSAQPLGYTRPDAPPIDCFYLYPTQSEQPTPNSNLDKDPPIRRVVVQQARMFSTVCDVYAPMYRQVTFSGNQVAYNPDVETAYQSAKAGFEDYLHNYNDGRGFILIGHSQGAAHTARLIDELIDPNPELRERFVGAIAPGANISVPIGQPVGGLFDNVPACTETGEYGCVVAFSTYNDVPGPTAEFSRLDYGYWIYPEPRPNPAQYEAMCTDPSDLDGGDNTLLPLVNFDYLSGVPVNETPAPWASEPNYYTAECKREGGAHWLNLGKVGLPGDTRPDVGALVASGSNYHVPELNLAEGNLLRIAQLQSDNYQAEQARLAKLKKLDRKLSKSKHRLGVQQRKIKGLKRKLKSADSAAERQAVQRKLRSSRRKAATERKKIKSLRKKIKKLKKQAP